MLPTLTDFLAFKGIFFDYRAEAAAWGLDLYNGLVVTSLCKSSSLLAFQNNLWHCVPPPSNEIVLESSSQIQWERRRLMTEEYIVERLALFCNTSLMLSINGSKKVPDFSWDLVILKTVVCQQKPLPGALSQLLWSKPTSSIPPGRLPQHTYMVACQQPPSPALFVPEGFAWILCTQSFLYALKFQFSVELLTVGECFCGYCWSQEPALTFLELLLSQLILAGNQLRRDVLNLKATCENQFLHLQSLYHYVFCWS